MGRPAPCHYATASRRCAASIAGAPGLAARRGSRHDRAGHRPGHRHLQHQGGGGRLRRHGGRRQERPARHQPAAPGLVRAGRAGGLVGAVAGPAAGPAGRRAGRRFRDQGGRHQRNRPVPAGLRQGGQSAAAGDPVRDRHAGHRRGRRADRAARRGRHPGPVGVRLVVAGGRAEAAVAAAPRARRLGPHGPLVQRELVPGGTPHRRVPARPPHGEPVRPDVRHPRAVLGQRLGGGAQPGCRPAPAGLARRDSRPRDRARVRRHGTARRARRCSPGRWTRGPRRTASACATAAT